MGFPYLKKAFDKEICLETTDFKSEAFINGRTDTLIVKLPAFSVLIVFLSLIAKAILEKTSRFFLLIKY